VTDVCQSTGKKEKNFYSMSDAELAKEAHRIVWMKELKGETLFPRELLPILFELKNRLSD